MTAKFALLQPAPIGNLHSRRGERNMTGPKENTMPVIEQLAEFVATAEASRLPPLDRNIQRRHLADTVVARIAGANSHEGRLLAKLEKPCAETAAGIASLAACVRATEIDDIHIASCTTVSSVAVPVALGLAARGGADPARLLGAMWAGTELAIRFAKAIDGARVLYQGVWPTRTAAPLASAAVASRMLGLSSKETAHALSLALMMTPSRIGKFTGEPTGRWIVFMAAVGDGIRAAEAARAGFKSDLALLDGAWLDKMLGVPVDMATLTRGLGETSVYPELSLKPFCTSRQALSATQAMRQMLADGLDPAGIEGITVRVPSAYAAMISTKLDPAVRATSYVSAGAQMAIAAFQPEHLHDVDRATVLVDTRIQKLAALVQVEADSAMDADFPRRWPAEIEVRSAGSVRKLRVDEPPGDPGRRLDDAALAAKAKAVLAHVGMAESASGLLGLAGRATSDAAACKTLSDLFVEGEPHS